MKGVDVQIHVSLTSALVGDEWSASLPGRFTPIERVPDTHWIGSWMGRRSDLYHVKKENLFPLSGLEILPSVVQPVVSRYTD
jgi:hypothetical protein